MAGSESGSGGGSGVLRVVVFPGMDSGRVSALRSAGGAGVEILNAGGVEEALGWMGGASGFIGKLTPELLAAAGPGLRWVQAVTASLEHYMFPALAAHPCVLTNTRGLFGDVIADQTMGYILCFARNLHIYVRRQVAGVWAPAGGEGDRVDNATGPGVVNAIDRATIHLADSTLGVFGCGGIGREVARRACGFGMRAIGVDRFPGEVPGDSAFEEVRGPEGLDWLLGESDFVVIAAPWTPETEGLFDAGTIRKMKRSAYLINVGRGAIVRLDDLAGALESGTIAGAALDVFETEPLPAGHPLWGMENAILTPHTAGYSTRIAERHLGVLTENARRFAAGEPLMNVVRKDLWF